MLHTVTALHQFVCDRVVQSASKELARVSLRSALGAEPSPCVCLLIHKPPKAGQTGRAVVYLAPHVVMLQHRATLVARRQGRHSDQSAVSIAAKGGLFAEDASLSLLREM